jgi:hypothetical protein
VCERQRRKHKKHEQKEHRVDHWDDLDARSLEALAFFKAHGSAR